MSIFKRASFASLLVVAMPIAAVAQISVGISVNLAPPELPVYSQPPIPGDGYLWTPGYWAWGDGDYYWVPGTWIEPPTPGYLWTPGYWAANGGEFVWNAGYWGETVGFYGGVNYGYGYGGRGFEGGYWRGGHLFYNRSVNNIGVTRISNVYNTRITNNYSVQRASYNGGSGGTHARPTPTELSAAQRPHEAPTPAQQRHFEAAKAEPSLRVSANHGRPPIAATAKPGELAGGGAVPSREVAPSRAMSPRHEMAQPARQAAPQEHAAPEERAPSAQQRAPQEHAPPPQQHAAPQERAPAPQQRAAPQERAPPPQQHAPPPQRAQEPHPEPAHGDDHEHHPL
jgi:hypothetical protein